MSVLSQKFLDDQIKNELSNPTTFHPDLDRLAAFRLLIHAELEDFLEAKAREKLDAIIAIVNAGSAWMRQYPGFVVLAITVEKPPPVIDLVDTQRFLDYATEVLEVAKRKVGENNGIKARSFLFLSICAGKTIEEIDQFLSGSLNSYGKNRGDVAHKSVMHTSSLQAPSAELTSAQSLVHELATYFGLNS